MMPTVNADVEAGKALCQRLQGLLKDDSEDVDLEALRAELHHQPVVCIALAMDDLTCEQACQVFRALDEGCAAEVLSKIDPEYTREIVKRFKLKQFEHLVSELPPREASAIVAEAPEKLADELIADSQRSRAVDDEVTVDAENRMPYAEGTAGRLMTQIFVRLRPDMKVSAALEAVRQSDPETDIPNNLYVVAREKEGCEKLLGIISIRDLLMADPDRRVSDLMATDVTTVKASEEDDDVALLLSKYKFLSLPVLDEDDHLVGVIPADDLMRVAVSRLHRRYSQAVGTDAAAMEDASPFQAAKMRVPWLMATIVLELGAGAVISHFDDVLKRVILLASFMPVISAVSGNVGLQAAAITVRGLDTGEMGLKRSGAALLKEASTTLFMAAVCGTVLGVIGFVWSRHFQFSLVIGGALICSMMTAGMMGTIIPMVSKKLGFDPAATAGPFETAFQDIIGFGVFLALASLLLQSMH
jgi:magnesium transporter